MTVTQLEPFSRGKGRVSVYLNNEFAFVLYKGELSEYGIKVGSEIDSKLYDRILNDTLILRAKKRGMNLLQKMDRTEADIRQKLSESGYPKEAADAAVEYLKSYHYIDDARYAAEYIRFRSSTMSKKQISRNLLQKGIKSDVIDNELASFYSDDDNDGEYELIRKCILKKCGSGLGSLNYEDKQKLYAGLYRKGFSVADIDKVYNELT